MAAYGAPPRVHSSGYGPGVDTVVATEHQHRQRQRPLPHPQANNPPSPPFPYASQGSPRGGRRQDSFSHYPGNDVSPTYPNSASGSGSHYTTSPVLHDSFEMPTAKRRKVSDVGASRRSSLATTVMKDSPARRESMAGASPLYTGKGRRESESIDPKLSKASPTASKPKRVRTGCLTCRNRHLKCDEAMPICMNCQKSNRKCERGVRLNFIDLKVEQPPYLLPRVDWKGKSFRVVQMPSASLEPSFLVSLALPLAG